MLFFLFSLCWLSLQTDVTNFCKRDVTIHFFLVIGRQLAIHVDLGPVVPKEVGQQHPKMATFHSYIGLPHLAGIIYSKETKSRKNLNPSLSSVSQFLTSHSFCGRCHIPEKILQNPSFTLDFDYLHFFFPLFRSISFTTTCLFLEKFNDIDAYNTNLLNYVKLITCSMII